MQRSRLNFQRSTLNRFHRDQQRSLKRLAAIEKASDLRRSIISDLHALRQTCAYELGNWEELKQIAESKIIIPCRLLSQINAACDGAIMELEKRRVQLQLLLQRNFR